MEFSVWREDKQTSSCHRGIFSFITDFKSRVVCSVTLGRALRTERALGGASLLVLSGGNKLTPFSSCFRRWTSRRLSQKFTRKAAELRIRNTTIKTSPS